MKKFFWASLIAISSFGFGLVSCVDDPDGENLYTSTGETIEGILTKDSTLTSFTYILQRANLLRTMASYGQYTVSASLSTNSWTSGNYNMSQSSESNRFRIGSRSRLNYTPHFNNENISVTMMAQYEFHQSKSSAQSNTMQQLPGGITSTVADGYLSAMSSSNSRSADQNLLYLS